MKRRCWFSGSRKRNVPASNCAQSEPNAWADMQSASTREFFEPGLDLRRDAVAGVDFPFIKPHPQPVPTQPLRHPAHDILVLRAVAQEDIVLEIVSHGSPRGIGNSVSDRAANARFPLGSLLSRSGVASLIR